MNAIARHGRRLLRSNGRAMQVTRFVALALVSPRILVFRPSRREWGTPADVGMAFERDDLAAGRDRIRAWWLPQPGASVAVIVFPGRAANISYELSTFEYLAGLGVSVLAVDYPGFGESTGQAREENCYAAARAAWDCVEQKGFAPERAILYGRSLGAAVAAWLGARANWRGLVFHGGFSSMQDLGACYMPRWLVRARCHAALDAAASIAACRCPVIVLHARDDRLVPIALARRVFARAPGAKAMIELPGDHFSTDWMRQDDVRREWERLIHGR
jgi:pimeloyl-ACP methyl ester carboxylesterase